ncbi:MAG: hypothetical protein ACREF5_02525 [Candidatus Saccharimonadales bacterium]
MEHEKPTQGLTGYKLPDLVMSLSDISRLRRELEALDAYLRQEKLRNSGQPSARLPKMSRLVDELSDINKLNLLDDNQRQQLTVFLTKLVTDAPVVNISFAVDPSSAFLLKIIQWFRRNIHQYILLQVGLEPSIAAGCVVRTTNQYHDFSLRAYFKEHKDELIGSLGGTSHE